MEKTIPPEYPQVTQNILGEQEKEKRSTYCDYEPAVRSTGGMEKGTKDRRFFGHQGFLKGFRGKRGKGRTLGL